MIHLDANYLIAGATISTVESANIRRWLSEGESLGASAVAWMEFVTGPISQKASDIMLRVLEERIFPMGKEEAELAAHLFNAAARKRSLKYDCMIAATAMRAGARLATTNLSDHRLFVESGLKLV